MINLDDSVFFFLERFVFNELCKNKSNDEYNMIYISLNVVNYM